MPLFLRQIKNSKWYRHEGVPWLPPGELQADALGDLHTHDNKLSVWHVDDGRSNLHRVLAAIAAGRDHLSNVDYALVDASVIAGLNIPIEPSPGSTPDEDANSLWHRNFIELTRTKLLELAEAIAPQPARARLLAKEVAELLLQSLESGILSRSGIKPELLKRLGVDS